MSEGSPTDDAAPDSPQVETGATDADEPSDPGAVLDSLEHPLLLFDGVCNLCNGFVRFVVKFDAEGEFLFAPLQSDVGQKVLERNGMDTDDFETFVLLEDGDLHTKSTAALRVTRRLDGPWPLSSPLLYVPTGLRDGVYDLVADNRYRLFGKKDQCPIPEPEIRERFADRTLESARSE